MCHCRERPSAGPLDDWQAITWQDERNAARYLELMATLGNASERHAQRLLSTLSFFPDVPSTTLPSGQVWLPPRQLVFADEIAFVRELMRFGDVDGFKASAATESKSDTDGPCEPCTRKFCGPNVTDQVIAAVNKTKQDFASWDDNRKYGACKALNSMQGTGGGEMMAAVAWDIVDLHNQDWIATYNPPCAAPPCQKTVQVGDQCYYAGSANYVIFGVMCKLCKDYMNQTWRFVSALDYSEQWMLLMITAYKGGIPGMRSASGNYEISQKWASAGYNGWPSASAPPGDRPNCQAACPRPYSGGPFSVNWHWLDGSGGVLRSEPTPGTF